MTKYPIDPIGLIYWNLPVSHLSYLTHSEIKTQPHLTKALKYLDVSESKWTHQRKLSSYKLSYFLRRTQDRAVSKHTVQYTNIGSL